MAVLPFPSIHVAGNPDVGFAPRVGVEFTPRAKAHAVWAREQTWLPVEHFYDILVEDYFVHGDDY